MNDRTTAHAMKKKTLRENIEEAKEAHCDLNILEAVVAILEAGTASATIFTTQNRITALVRAEQQRCLKRMDRAMERAGAPYPIRASDD